MGFILDSMIYFREEPIFEYSKKKRKIQSIDGKNVLLLEGNHCEFKDLDLFGIAITYLENKWWNKITNLEIKL